jgi:hypothetical protein
MKMNFVNDRELALRFKNDAVPSRERLIYFLLFLVPATALSTTYVINFLYDPSANIWDYAIDTSYVLITVVGTILCYITNKNGDDREFIERYMSIGFPTIVKTTLIFILILLINIAIYYFMLGYDQSDESTYVALIYTLAFFAAYFWRLNYCIKLASH